MISLRVLHAEKVDKFILVTVECEGYPAHSDIRSAAINAALDAGYKFDLGSERMSGRGNVTTLSWQALPD